MEKNATAQRVSTTCRWPMSASTAAKVAASIQGGGLPGSLVMIPLHRPPRSCRRRRPPQPRFSPILLCTIIVACTRMTGHSDMIDNSSVLPTDCKNLLSSACTKSSAFTDTTSSSPGSLQCWIEVNDTSAIQHMETTSNNLSWNR
ncbi:unnamed protein product [Musa banksii]